MKFNNSTLSETYSEVGQTNPLRWANLYREEDGSFTYESGKWKCKDFLNEFVSKYHGHSPSIYGFNAGKMRVNEEGVYVTFFGVLDENVFLSNLWSINKWAAECGFPETMFHKFDGQLILLLPRQFFSNTYSISLLSYLIRVSNVTVPITDWRKHPTRPVDSPFEAYYDKAMDRGFKPPVENSWHYLGEWTNLEKPDVGLVHDNGVYDWFNNLEMAEA